LPEHNQGYSQHPCISSTPHWPFTLKRGYHSSLPEFPFGLGQFQPRLAASTLGVVAALLGFGRLYES
jgi:hypothetical protein